MSHKSKVKKHDQPGIPRLRRLFRANRAELILRSRRQAGLESISRGEGFKLFIQFVSESASLSFKKVFDSISVSKKSTMETAIAIPAAPAAPPKKAIKKASAPKKAKAPADHPKYADMAVAAIGSLKERGGSSRQAIQKYIIATFKVGNDAKIVNQHLKTGLKSALKSGKIKHAKGQGASGSFKLAEGAKAKTIKAAKKPKTPKKAAAPKKTGEKKIKKAKSPKKPKAEKASKTKKTAKPKSPKKAKAIGGAAKAPSQGKTKKPKAKTPKKTKAPKKAAAKKTPAKKAAKPKAPKKTAAPAAPISA